MPVLFFELSLVLVLATVFGIVSKALKQPLVLAYILAGVVISIFGLFKVIDKSSLELLSNLGIAFLLFLVGIELKVEDLKYVGKAAILTGIGQIIFTALVGFILIAALGFSTVAALYMAVALTFSSTVIIIKLLSEKNELKSLYGKISVGYLLIQDFVAILALMFLSGFGAGQGPSLAGISFILIKGAIFAGASYLASRYLLKYLFKLTSTSTELLFISAIAYAFFSAAVGAKIGFSIAIGAFIAGLAIASSPYRLQISARVKPLRDFFIVIFFILLGASLSIGAAGVYLSQIIILTLFILIGKPLIMLAIMLSLKFRNRTSFLASITGAQISEFSLILMTVGLGLGHLKAPEASLISAVGVATITISSYMILFGGKIYRVIEKPFARIFPERAHDPYVSHRENLLGHTILVGAEQMGWDILEFLKTKYKDKKQILVVDFNPEIINALNAAGYNAVFGDISDPEVLEELELGKANLVIITDPDVSDNDQLIKFAKERNYRGPVISTAYWLHDAIKLYELGADYVVVPETVGGKHLSKILGEEWDELSKIKKQKSRNFEELMSHKIF